MRRIPKTDPLAGEANFLLGMSEFYRGNFDKAFAAFSYLATRMPLTEVYNNLGVVEARRGRRASAVEYFTKAVNADPNDADYRFNLAVALFKNGDSAAAARQLKDELQQRPNDGEAKTLLDMINRGVRLRRHRRPPDPRAMRCCRRTSCTSAWSVSSATTTKLPIASWRWRSIISPKRAWRRWTGQTHAAYHVDQGKELLAQNMPDQAEVEFREAISCRLQQRGRARAVGDAAGEEGRRD